MRWRRREGVDAEAPYNCVMLSFERPRAGDNATAGARIETGARVVIDLASRGGSDGRWIIVNGLATVFKVVATAKHDFNYLDLDLDLFTSIT